MGTWDSRVKKSLIP